MNTRNWQAPSSLIGKGYVWSSLTEAQKKAFVANPDNNCYLDGDKTIQVRYRVRVVQGLGDNWEYINSQTGSSLAYNVTQYVQAKGKIVNTASDLSTGTYFYNSGYSNRIDSGIWISSQTSTAYDGKCFALPIALIHRRNQGMYHSVYNPNGTRKAVDGNFFYNTTETFTSISDCFNQSKLLTASGYIGTVSGRPDGLFYDQVHEGDILDLRNSSKKVEDYNRLISREFNKLVVGTYRGKESEWSIVKTHSATPVSKGSTGINLYVEFAVGTMPIQLRSNTGSSDISYGVFIDASGNLFKVRGTHTSLSQYVYLQAYYGSNLATINIAGSCTVILTNNTTRTKSNTLLHCDIIGNPANYPASWKESGVFGTPLIVAEDGTSLLPDGAKDAFKLSRKANATPLLCLRSTDSGVTWTTFTPTFSATTNALTLTDEPANNLVMVYYQTHTSMAVPTVNSEVVEIGNVFSANNSESQHGAYLTETLIKKVPVWYGKSAGYPLKNYELFGKVFWVNSARAPVHETLTYNQFGTSNPAIKVLPYLTTLNGKAYLNLMYKELKHNGTSWGDDSKFNIVDNVSTTTDNNAQTVLIGQKTVELLYFIGADE